MKLTAVAFLLFAACNVGTPQDSLFRPAVVIALPNKSSNVALADLNKDGRLDLIVTSEEARTLVSEPRAVATGSSGCYGTATGRERDKDATDLNQNVKGITTLSES